MNLDHLNSLSFYQRVSLFGKVIKQEEERQASLKKEIINEPLSKEFQENNYKPLYTEKEKHLETMFLDSHDEVI